MCDIKLPSVEQTDRFRDNINKHIDFVLNAYKSSPDLLLLIGDNPFRALEDAQRYLGRTILAVFEYGNIQLQKRILPWVYRSYIRHGFNIDYFSNTLKLWIKSIERSYDDPVVYTAFLYYLLNLDSENRLLSKEVPPSWLNSQDTNLVAADDLQRLFQLLVENDVESAIDLIDEFYNRDRFSAFEDLIKPVLYEVGRYWELDKMSVADEHRISAVISSYIASVTSPAASVDNSILITPAPNEYHEIGAQMLAAAFMDKGWTVIYRNAGTPADEVIKEIKHSKPDIAAFSASLILSALNLKEMIKQVKEKFPDLPVLVGGRFVADNPETAVQIGADAHAFRIDEAIQTAERLVGKKIETK